MKAAALLLCLCFSGCIVAPQPCSPRSCPPPGCPPHRYPCFPPSALQYNEPQHPVVGVDGRVQLMPHSAAVDWFNGSRSATAPLAVVN